MEVRAIWQVKVLGATKGPPEIDGFPGIKAARLKGMRGRLSAKDCNTEKLLQHRAGLGVCVMAGFYQENVHGPDMPNG